MHPASLPFLFKLQRSQWLPTEALERLQWQRLASLLDHAYRQTRYYRHLFDAAGILPGDIRSMGDLKHLPVTTKDDVQNEPIESFIAKGFENTRWIERRTSGTTGQPLRFLLTRRQKEAQDMVQARALMANGMKLTDRRAVFVAPWQIPSNPLWFQRLGLWRKLNLSVFEDVATHMPALIRNNPQSIAGTPAMLNLLAIENAKPRNGSLHPRTLFSSGDLLDNGTRRRIETSLGAPVTDLFGSLEFGFIGWECPEHRGYHINMESVLVEVDENGEMICTNLLARGMPLIRYRLGDRCQLETAACPCGRGLPLIKLIEGRTNDQIHLPGGRIVTPQAVADAMVQFADRIQQFRIIQQRPDLIEAMIVPAKNTPPDSPAEITQGLRTVLGNQIEISYRCVDQIEPDPSGKRRAVISKLDSRDG